MSMRVLALESGILEGERVQTSLDDDFLWIDPEKLRAYRQATSARLLYRRDPVGKRGNYYTFAGLTHRRCAGCGVYHEKQESCELCGASLAS